MVRVNKSKWQFRLIYSVSRRVQNKSKFFIMPPASSDYIRAPVTSKVVSTLYKILKYVSSRFPVFGCQCSRYSDTTTRAGKVAAGRRGQDEEEEGAISFCTRNPPLNVCVLHAHASVRSCVCCCVYKLHMNENMSRARGWQFSLTSGLRQMHRDMLGTEMANVPLQVEAAAPTERWGRRHYASRDRNYSHFAKVLCI